MILDDDSDGKKSDNASFLTCGFQIVEIPAIRFCRIAEFFYFFTIFLLFPLTSFANQGIVITGVRVVILS